MERIRELLQSLTTLSLEELTELRSLILAEADNADSEAVTPESVAVLNELAEAGEQVMSETGAREAAQAQAEADATSARERIAAINAQSDDDEEEPAAPSEDEEEAPAEEPAPEGEAAPAEAAVVAGGAVGRMAARAPRAKKSPEADEPTPNRAVLTASGAMRGVSGEIKDRYELAEAMSDTLKRMPRNGAGRGDVLLASATWEYPEDRRLGEDDSHNARVMDAITHPSALVATGGICAPVNVDYTVPTWATADRPLRDGLPSFQATRGGIRFVQPPDIGGLASATGIWTSATDASPGAATKPVLQIACGSEVQVLVDAIPTRLGFGNMQSRFAPEQVAANTDLAIAAAARIAENNLLNKIAALCVGAVTAPGTALLGATRDIVTALDQAVAGYKQVHRLPANTKFTAILPSWLKDLIRIDLAREIAHEQSSEWNSLMVDDSKIDALLAAHGINPIWHIDGQDSSVAGGQSQVFVAQTASGAIKPFPTKCVWYFFPEGTFQFLDGGRLDLGVVRDATLDATNDYETFVETFEAIAFRGFSGGAIQYVSTLCANGGSAGTISTAGACA